MKNSFVATGLLMLSTVVSAHPDLQSVTVTANECNAQHLGSAISVKEIGERVSSVVLDEFRWSEAKDKSPSACIVNGRLMPIDKSATARPIRFSVGLPAVWNRRSLHEGGFGINGLVPQFVGGVGPFAMMGAGSSALANGFAVYGSDSGHGQESEWTLNDEAIKNFGYEQLKKTNDVAQILIHRMYGNKPTYRYFVGASQGGREALTVAQRYPRDYDGISAQVPVVGLGALMQAPTLIRRQERALINWVPPTKGKAIAAEFMRQCDGLDGLDDGVINNYMACRRLFNVTNAVKSVSPWLSRRCPDGMDPDPANSTESACLTDGQISTLSFVFSSHNSANESHSFGMWMPSTEVAGGGIPMGGNALITDVRYLGQEGAASDAKMFTALGSVGVTGFLLRDLPANPLTYVDRPEYRQRNRQLSEWLDSTNPDLSSYQKLGGKLVVAIGTNDTLASTGAQLDYYAALVKRMGQKSLDRFARLYVLPQRGHGLQGSSYGLTGEGKSISSHALPSRYEPLAMLQNWVENAQAPSAEEVVTGAQGSSNLMCTYPRYPHYQNGPIDKATSYHCEQ